ncbi:hypothetical protein [Chamaesiphon sp. VAR_69_metabat_338]|uniref:hypothetical protein n=1 Tax=Chamaesiphon sp. VAR_69_metabat_338 TaxID=2964704 RepID=UPI00286D7E96|nr:hypothetical protein [Chamaesiphon sp. VAR_69_metabat_338]
MTNSIAKADRVMWQEITEDRAECVNGGSWKQEFNLGDVGAIQVNGGNGVQNNYYIFNFFLGGKRRL